MMRTNREQSVLFMVDVALIPRGITITMHAPIHIASAS
jgi:hypothetical protein